MNIPNRKLITLLDEGATIIFASFYHPTKGRGTIGEFGRVVWDDPTLQHTCSYHCDRPECIKRQRDELRERLRT